MMKQEKVTIFKESEEMLKLTDVLAKAEGVSRSDLIRRGLRREVDSLLRIHEKETQQHE
jgi:hypothetical protein